METEETFTDTTDLSEIRNAVDKIRAEAAKIIVGQDKILNLLIASILAEGHVLIEGVPGLAKTLMAKILARTISVPFSRIQFTPDLMPSDVTGTSIYNSKTNEFEFRKGPLFSNVILIDEINRAPAKTQAALFEVMEELQISVDGTTYPMAEPFLVLATQNPIDQEGTYRLPEAQLDRFIFKVVVDYPSIDEELHILSSHSKRKRIHDIEDVNAVVSAAEVIKMREQVRHVHVEEKLLRFITQIVNTTRNNNALYLGASPRASIAIMMGAKALAAMSGRSFVIPEDIKDVCLPVLAHRIILAPEREMEGVTPAQIVKQIVDGIEVPR